MKCFAGFVDLGVAPVMKNLERDSVVCEESAFDSFVSFDFASAYSTAGLGCCLLLMAFAMRDELQKDQKCQLDEVEDSSMVKVNVGLLSYQTDFGFGFLSQLLCH